MDGITGWSQFWKIKLPLILPSIGIISILTFVGNFNAFDLIYVSQGALAGPNFATDILGTFLYRTFFGFQLQLGDPHMGAAIATAMFFIILVGVSIYLFGIQTPAAPLPVLRSPHVQAPAAAARPAGPGGGGRAERRRPAAAGRHARDLRRGARAVLRRSGLARGPAGHALSVAALTCIAEANRAYDLPERFRYAAKAFLAHIMQRDV